MTGRTTIEWTSHPGYVGAVWNPTTGCTRVSAGCDNCYAFALHDKRYKSNLDAGRIIGNTGHLPGEVAAAARARGVKLPWPKQYDLPFSHVQLLPERLDAPLRTRKPTCYFVDSMSDLFHEDVPDEYIVSVFVEMGLASHHRFLILTKRPARMREFVTWWADNETMSHPSLDKYKWPWSHVWLGTSVEDQASADERIPHLLATPSAVRFLSCEPLLGPVDLTRWLGGVPHASQVDEHGRGRVTLHDEVRHQRGQESRNVVVPIDLPDADGLPSVSAGFPRQVAAERRDEPLHHRRVRVVDRDAGAIRTSGASSPIEVPLAIEETGDVPEHRGVDRDRDGPVEQHGAGSSRDTLSVDNAPDGSATDAESSRDAVHRFSGDVVRNHGRTVQNDAPHGANSIDWCIVGGESGPRARPMDLTWARSLVAQCRAAGVAPFVKQLGSFPTDVADGAWPYPIRESHGRDITEWPADLRVREWPSNVVAKQEQEAHA